MNCKRIFSLLLSLSLIGSQTAFATSAPDADQDPCESDSSCVDTVEAEPSEGIEEVIEVSEEAPVADEDPEASEPAEPGSEAPVDPDPSESSAKEEPSSEAEAPAEEEPVQDEGASEEDQRPADAEQGEDEAEESTPVEEEAAEPSEDAESSEEPAQEEITEPELIENPALEEIEFTYPITADENGNIQLPADGSLADILFPTEIGGYAVTNITDDAFRGTSYFKTVTIPASITKIGANAFAECEGLEYIILQDRADAEDMILGENWSGDAVVIYGLVEAPSEDVAEEEQQPADAEQAEGEEALEGEAEESTPAEGEEGEPTEDTVASEEPSEPESPAEEEPVQDDESEQGGEDPAEGERPELPAEPIDPSDGGLVPIETEPVEGKIGKEEDDEIIPVPTDPVKKKETQSY